MNPLEGVYDKNSQEDMQNASYRRALECEREHRHTYFGEADAAKMDALGVKVKGV